MQTSLQFQTFGTAYLNHVLHGNSEMIKHIIGMFKVQTPDLMNQLRNAVHRGDRELIRVTAHKMKSAAGILEAKEIRDTLLMMEEQAKTTIDSARLKELMASLEEMVKKTMEEMELNRH
jgi:HPt (histidine-containing phosphotransfer) domain-containing protein